MENARQIGARTGSHGPRAPGKIAKSHEAGPRYGGTARINAAVPYKLIEHWTLGVQRWTLKFLSVDVLRAFRNDRLGSAR